MADKIHSRTGEAPHSIVLFAIVYVLLLLLMGITLWAAFTDLGRHVNNAIAVVIPSIKMLLIMMVFMHIRWQKWTVWFFAAAGVVWLCIMMNLTMTDYVTRNKPPNSSPKGEPVFVYPK